MKAMWTVDIEDIKSFNAIKYRILDNDNRLSFGEFMELLINSQKFRLFFNDILVTNNFKSYFFEVKPVTTSSVDQEFEFVLVNNVN